MVGVRGGRVCVPADALSVIRSYFAVPSPSELNGLMAIFTVLSSEIHTNYYCRERAVSAACQEASFFEIT